MKIDKKYIIKKNKSNTILINKYDTDEIYLFDKVSKIIIDNIDKDENYVVNLIIEKYNVDYKIALNDYRFFIKSINNFTNIETNKISSSKLNSLLNSNNIKECTIEITNVCPFKCDHCYLPKNNHKNMNFNEFKNVVDQLYSLNVNHILLTGGDPLYNPSFNKMYAYLKNKGLFVHINTTLYYLNDNLIDLFKKFKPDGIEISIYGYDNNSYDKFTHSKNSYDNVINNIKKLQNIGVKINLKTVLTKNNYLYISDIKKLSKQLNLPFRYDYILFPKLNEIGKKNSELLKPSQIIEVIKQDNEDVEYFKNAVKNIKLIQKNYVPSDNIFQCRLGKDRIFIDLFGNIKLCMVTLDKININDMSILDSVDYLNDKINILKLKKEDKCYNCYKKKICRYCPGRFKMETLSYTKPPKFYCDLADRLIKEFDIMFELYDNKNKITKNKYDVIYKFIIDNYLDRFKDKKRDEVDTIDAYNNWVNMILNTQNYNILLYYKNNKIIGFIAFMYIDNYLCLSEVQFDINYKNKGYLKDMLKEVIDRSDKSKYDKIYGNINKNNELSKNVFTHIGFKNPEKNRYEISYNDLLKWINS